MAALQHLTQRWQGAYFSRLVDRLARSARASGQPLHFVFRTSPSLALKTRDVGSVSVSTIGNVPVCTIDVNFLGLQGVCSPLPTHYTESILFAESPAVLDAFYNYFNQRIIEFSLKVRYSNDMLYRTAHKTNRYTDMVLCASGMQAQVEESPKQARRRIHRLSIGGHQEPKRRGQVGLAQTQVDDGYVGRGQVEELAHIGPVRGCHGQEGVGVPRAGGQDDGLGPEARPIIHGHHPAAGSPFDLSCSAAQLQALPQSTGQDQWEFAEAPRKRKQTTRWQAGPRQWGTGLVLSCLARFQHPTHNSSSVIGQIKHPRECAAGA